MTDEPRCGGNGLIVNSDGLVPEDPCVFQYSRSADRIGCNRLLCSRCQAFVRQSPGIKIKPDARPDPKRLYESADWSREPDLVPAKFFARLYTCRCGSWVEMGTTSLETDDPIHPTPPWSCGGHPRVTLPKDLDGVALAEGTDVKRLVLDVLEGRLVPPRALPGEKAVPRCWIIKLYELLLVSTNGQKLASRVPPAVASIFEPPVPEQARVRAEALGFFHAHADAPGWEKPLERFLAAPREFVGVVVPTMDPPTLEDTFLRVVGEHVAEVADRSARLEPLTCEVIAKGLVAAHARARETGDAPSLATAGGWVRVLSGAIACDNSAVASRAEEIVRGAPAVAVALLEGLWAAKSARLHETATKVVSIEGVDRKALAAFGKKVGGQVKAALKWP